MEGTASVLFSPAFFNCWKWLKAKPHYHTYEHQGVHAFVCHKHYYVRHFGAPSLLPFFSFSSSPFPSPAGSICPPLSFLFKGIVSTFYENCSGAWMRMSSENEYRPNFHKFWWVTGGLKDQLWAIEWFWWCGHSWNCSSCSSYKSKKPFSHKRHKKKKKKN